MAVWVEIYHSRDYE